MFSSRWSAVWIAFEFAFASRAHAIHHLRGQNAGLQNQTLSELAVLEDSCKCCATDFCCGSCPDCSQYDKANSVYDAGRDLPQREESRYIHDDPSGTHIRVRPSRIPGAGTGLFAQRALDKSIIMGPYKGLKAGTERLKELMKEGSPAMAYIWCPQDTAQRMAENAPDVGFCLDAKPVKEDNPLRYANGAKFASQCSLVNLESCEYDGALYFRTLHAVAADTELVLDYGDYYWDGKPSACH